LKWAVVFLAAILLFTGAVAQERAYKDYSLIIDLAGTSARQSMFQGCKRLNSYL
jgi:hypothetical protein